MGKPKVRQSGGESKNVIKAIKKKVSKSKALLQPSTSTLKSATVDEYNELKEEEEDSQNYNSIGFMKVELGETFEGYTIIRKTGYGNFSTVWLAYDMKNRKFVALKISKAKPSHVSLAHTEQETLQEIRDISPNHPGYDKVVHILNQFDLHRNNKFHPCTVFEPLGSSLLSKIYKSQNGIELPAIQKIARHILEALQYLHEECKLIHTDIKPENVLLTMSKKTMYKVTQQVMDMNFVGPGFGCNLKQNERKKLKANDIKRLKTIYSEICSHSNDVDPATVAHSGEALSTSDEKGVELEDWELDGSSDQENHNKDQIMYDMGYNFPKDIKDSKFKRFQKNEQRMAVHKEIMDPLTSIKLIDIGCALDVEKSGTFQITTLEYRSPEVIAEVEITPAVDIWSLGCMLFELVTAGYLFQAESEDKQNVQLLEQMIACLGPIPKRLYSNGQKYSEYFNSNGNYINKVKADKNILSRLLLYGYTRREVHEFNDLLCKMLEYDPSKRLTASECLNHSWLKTPLF